METLLLLAPLLLAVVSVYLWLRLQDARRQVVEKEAASDREAAAAGERARLAAEENATLRRANERLARWAGVADAEDRARDLDDEAQAKLLYAQHIKR